MLETFITNSGTGVMVLHTNEEVEMRDTQVLDSGNDVEFEPYETPIPLQRWEKKRHQHQSVNQRLKCQKSRRANKGRCPSRGRGRAWVIKRRHGFVSF